LSDAAPLNRFWEQPYDDKLRAEGRPLLRERCRDWVERLAIEPSAFMDRRWFEKLNATEEQGVCPVCQQWFFRSRINNWHGKGGHPPVLCRVCWLSNRKITKQEAKQRWQERNPKPPIEPRDCLVCGAAFTPKRKDARCCSGKCRAKLSRQKPAVTEPAAVEAEVVVRRKAP
jgi:hypothetical protein